MLKGIFLQIAVSMLFYTDYMRVKYKNRHFIAQIICCITY
jgi:hypothetical protein